MGETVKVDAHMVEICEPWEAGEHDPSMQEWLVLPISEAICPLCGSTRFGTGNPRGYFQVRYCHDEFVIGCMGRWRNPVNAEMILNVVSALNGEPRRFGMGPA